MIIKNKIILFTVFLFFTNSALKADTLSLNEFKDEYKIRIREAMRINEMFSDSIWEGLAKTPFNIILVTDNYEYLVNANEPYTGFSFAGYDTLLSSNIYMRERVFNNNLLATFPVDKGIPTIVVGTPSATSRNGVDWTITLLHEHFHQYQYSQPDYYAAVNELDLSGGDQSGMWMLNYPFPYEDPEKDSLYYTLAQKLQPQYPNPFSPSVKLETREDFLKYKEQLNKERISKIKNYFAERKNFTDKLNEKDYKYFSFQIWQEGLARYTEGKFYDLLQENHYEPSNEYKALGDTISLNSYALKFKRKNANRLVSQKLNENQRNCFYTLGFFEGYLLDEINPGWRKKYFTDKFFIEKYVE